MSYKRRTIARTHAQMTTPLVTRTFTVTFEAKNAADLPTSLNNFGLTGAKLLWHSLTLLLFAVLGAVILFAARATVWGTDGSRMAILIVGWSLLILSLLAMVPMLMAPVVEWTAVPAA